MSQTDLLYLETQIANTLRLIYDPEIPVNIYDLGLVYEVDVDTEKNVVVTMTLTAPNCPMADDLLAEVEYKVAAVPGVKSVRVNLVFDPPWDKSMLTDEAKLELGLL